MKLLIATRNPDKLKEFRQILGSINYQLLSLDQIKSIPQDFDVQETGKTFKANAVLKAKTYGNKAQTLTLADDSGLIIDNLPDQLEVNSAKFAQGNYPQAQKKIIHLLKHLPPSKRQAHYQICLALYNPQTKQLNTFSAQCQGQIAKKPQGQHGFGYDPIFFSPALNKTFGQASRTEKNQVSHRAKALKKLIQFLSPANTSNPANPKAAAISKLF